MLPPNFTLLQVTPELRSGGVEQTTIDIARAVVDAGGRALVASEGGRMVQELTAVGGEFVQMPVASKNPLRWALNAGALERLIQAEGVHLVHARSRAPAFAALAAARRTGRPFVATYHGVYNAKSPLKRWYNAVMTRGELVIANSEYTRAHVLKEHGVDPAKVVAIPRGVDLQRFDPEAVAPERVAAMRKSWGISSNERRAIFLLAGRLTGWKGQSFIAGVIDETNLDALLVLAGDDQGDGWHIKLDADELLRTDRARIVGHVADMPAAYLAADVALAPSLEPEAFGRTAVEPQAMGRPVIAADHGATPETVEQGVTGLRVAPNDDCAWADALRQAASWSPERRAEMGAAGRERVKRLFSLERMQADTLAAYARVLEARR